MSFDAAASGKARVRESIKAPPGGGSGLQTLKRAQNLAQLSKSKRDANFNKRRRPHEATAEGETNSGEQAATTAKLSVEQVRALIESFRSSYQLGANSKVASAVINPAVPSDTRLAHLQSLRVLLSSHDDETTIELVVGAGAVPMLIAELSASDVTAVSQMDALWALTNIASDSTAHTRAVMPAAPMLISLLSSANVKVQEQCVWCLGNLASEEEECRRQLISNGLLVPLVRLLSQALPSQMPPPPQPVPAPTNPASLSLLRVVCWALSNLVKSRRTAAGSPHAAYANDPATRALATFAADLPKLLFATLRSSDDRLATETAWIISAWANKGDSVMKEFFQLGFHESLLSRFAILQSTPEAQGSGVVIDPVTNTERDPLASALIPLVRILGNAAHADDALVHALISYQFPASVSGAPVPNALHLICSTLERSLRSINRGLKKETCWVLSNFAGTAIPIVHEALAVSGQGPSTFVRLLVEMLPRVVYDVQREVLHAIYNLARMNNGQFTHLVLPLIPDHAPAESVSTGVILHCCFDCLRARDPESILTALRIVELMLRVHPAGVRIVEHEGGIDALESVQQNTENVELVSYAQRLVDEFFGAEEEVDTGDQPAQEESEYPAWRLQHQTLPRPQSEQQASAQSPAEAGPPRFQF